MKYISLASFVLVLGFVLGFEFSAREYEKILRGVHRRNSEMLGLYVREALRG